MREKNLRQHFTIEIKKENVEQITTITDKGLSLRKKKSDPQEIKVHIARHDHWLQRTVSHSAAIKLLVMLLKNCQPTNESII